MMTATELPSQKTITLLKYVANLIILLTLGQVSPTSGQTPTPTPWATSGNNIYSTNTGNVGVNTSSPDSRLSVGGKLRLFDSAPPGSGSDAGYLFGAAIPSGLVTEVSGELLTFGINVPQLGARNTVRVGGLFRLDTRTSEQRFVVYAYPAGGSVATDRFSVNLQNGNVLMAPSGGNVGVGTTSPASIFTVNLNNTGVTNANGAGSHFVMTNPNASGQNVITSIVNGATVAKWRSDYVGNSSLVAGPTGKHDFYTGGDWPSGTVRMTILNNGNVGIGRPAPGYKLDVDGSVNATGLCLGGACKSAWSEVGGSQWTTGGSNIIFYNAGSVGIGTPSPGVRLAVNGAGVNVYNTDAWIENNLHAQGNESLAQGGRGRVRVGTAWGYSGLYSEVSSTGAQSDLVLGASSGLVRVGPGATFGAAQSLIVPNGSVGIGTATVPPSDKLHVAGNIKATGDITADGTIAAKYQDVAEWVPARGPLAAGTVVVLDPEASNRVMASSEPYDTRVAGVVSATPGLILGQAGDGKVKVATTGRVRVKVDATRGPVEIGDLLVTSDVAGVAMKSEPVNVGGRKLHAPGTIVGKALEPLEKGVGEILVLLSLQ